MGLNKQELATIHATNLGNFGIKISCSQDGFWRGFVTLKQTGVEYPILTARGDTKTWRNPADAILFIQGVCPKCEDILMQIGDWDFVKSTLIKY